MKRSRSEGPVCRHGMPLKFGCVQCISEAIAKLAKEKRERAPDKEREITQ